MSSMTNTFLSPLGKDYLITNEEHLNTSKSACFPLPQIPATSGRISEIAFLSGRVKDKNQDGGCFVQTQTQAESLCPLDD